MRRFTETEKTIIERLVAHDQMSNNYVPLLAVFGDIFNQHRVKYFFSNPGELFFYRKFDQLDANELISVSNELLTISVLVDYLSEQGLAIIIPFPPSTGEDQYYGNFDIAADEQLIRSNLPEIIEEKLRTGFDNQIFVTETLRDLVGHEFKFPEDQILDKALDLTEKANEQISVASQQRDISAKMLEAAQEQSKEAKEQTKQAFIQTSEAKEQTRLAQVQSDEAIIQTQLAQTQTDEAIKQTKLAQDQSEEAKKQTDLAQEQSKEAKRQTCMSAIVLLISIITLIFTLAPTKCSNDGASGDKQESVVPMENVTSCSPDTSSQVKAIKSIEVNPVKIDTPKVESKQDSAGSQTNPKQAPTRNANEGK